jgi:hypothetical protein
MQSLMIDGSDEVALLTRGANADYGPAARACSREPYSSQQPVAVTYSTWADIQLTRRSSAAPASARLKRCTSRKRLSGLLAA